MSHLKDALKTRGSNISSYVKAFFSPQKERRIPIMVAVAVVICGVALTFISHAATATTITINGTASGPEFYGLGAISGGGGNSRFLIDYPSAERTQILNYLFKPDYGASLETLKLEIGGDTNSTDGSEASVEHSQGQLNCNSGYEWWLAEQALALNPNIKIYGLQWGAPGWVGDGSDTLWTQDDVNYVISWMNCAKSHGITVSYLGGWNERGYNATWYEELRTALNNNGFSGTQIVADDENSGTDTSAWDVASAMASDASFDSAVSILGVHDQCGAESAGYTCTTTSAARAVGKPMWQSELGAMDANNDTAHLVRSVINGYNQATQTGFIEWPIVDAMPEEIPYENRGAVTADQPWSGNYTINRMTWAFAQITQFVPAGWDYVGGANKTIGDSGSYNTFQAPNHSAWSMIAQNTGTSATETVDPQTISVTVNGGLPSSTVHVWETDLWSSNSSTWFQQKADIHPTNGTFSYTIPAGYVVAFTTTTGQSKGNAGTPPASENLSLAYSNSLTTDDGSDEPAVLAPQEGSFQMASCQGGISGNCTEQVAPQQPINWENDNNAGMYPYAIVGTDNWTNYTVSSKILFTQSGGSGGVIGRFTDRYTNGDGFNGYIFHVAANGKWEIIKNYSTNDPDETVLASGTTSALGTNTWHTLSFTLSGSKLTGYIDGKSVGAAVDTSYTYGLAGIEAGAFTNTWPINQYADFSASSVSSTTTSTVTINSGLAGKCLDDLSDSSANDNKVDLYSCNGSAAQKWVLAGGDTLQINGKCMDIYQQGTADRTPVDLFTCNGGKNQQWVFKGSTLVNPVSGKCLDDPKSSTTNGTQLELFTCNGGKNQEWTI